MGNNDMPSHHGVEEALSGRYPNQTVKLLIERASCRSFSDKKIAPNILQHILEAGIHAPTGGNLQPYSIIRIEDNKTKQKLAEWCTQDFIAQAAVDLLFCIDWHRLERWARLEIAPFSAMSSFSHFWISFQDTVICAQNICTAADSLGLGSVYVGTILQFLRETRDLFELPRGVIPIVLLCLGYPKGKRLPRKKLDIGVIVHTEKYHEISDQELKSAFDRKYPNVRIEITKERLEEISKVCRTVHGEEFAKRCVTRIKENGYINHVQRYFGLHYRADIMPQENDELLATVEELGFRWFSKYQRFHDQ